MDKWLPRAGFRGWIACHPTPSYLIAARGTRGPPAVVFHRSRCRVVAETERINKQADLKQTHKQTQKQQQRHHKLSETPPCIRARGRTGTTKHDVTNRRVGPASASLSVRSRARTGGLRRNSSSAGSRLPFPGPRWTRSVVPTHWRTPAPWPAATSSSRPPGSSPISRRT